MEKEPMLYCCMKKKETADLYAANDLRYPTAAALKKLYTDLMNHLQVPAGIGEGQSFSFDLARFSEDFKYNILEATYGLQAFEPGRADSIRRNIFQTLRIGFQLLPCRPGRSLKTCIPNWNR